MKRFTRNNPGGGIMSVEIEVGFENATNVPRLAEELSLEETPKGLANPKVRRLLIGAAGRLSPRQASPNAPKPRRRSAGPSAPWSRRR